MNPPLPLKEIEIAFLLSTPSPPPGPKPVIIFSDIAALLPDRLRSLVPLRQALSVKGFCDPSRAGMRSVPSFPSCRFLLMIRSLDFFIPSSPRSQGVRSRNTFSPTFLCDPPPLPISSLLGTLETHTCQSMSMDLQQELNSLQIY